MARFDSCYRIRGCISNSFRTRSRNIVWLVLRRSECDLSDPCDVGLFSLGFLLACVVRLPVVNYVLHLLQIDRVQILEKTKCISIGTGIYSRKQPTDTQHRKHRNATGQKVQKMERQEIGRILVFHFTFVARHRLGTHQEDFSSGFQSFYGQKSHHKRKERSSDRWDSSKDLLLLQSTSLCYITIISNRLILRHIFQVRCPNKNNRFRRGSHDRFSASKINQKLKQS